jgi:hypothetical protein
VYRERRITVVIPCLNEEKGIVEVLSRMPPFVDEVIVVDNDSTDRTAEVACAHGAKVIHERVRGYGRAYKTGLFHAQGDIIVTLDGDHSYPVDAISYLLEVFLHSNVRFLAASRFPLKNKQAMSFKHWIGNRVLSLAMSLLYFRWVRESQSGMWIFERDSLNSMDLQSDGMAFSEEIKIEAMRRREIGFKEIYIDYSNRMGEIKLQPWRDGLRNLLFLVRKRFSWRQSPARPARDPEPEGDVVPRRQVREEVEELKDHTDVGADLRQLPVPAAMASAAGSLAKTHLHPVHLHRPLVVGLQQVDAAKQRGLAAPRGANHHHDLALPDVKPPSEPAT